MDIKDVYLQVWSAVTSFLTDLPDFWEPGLMINQTAADPYTRVEISEIPW